MNDLCNITDVKQLILILAILSVEFYMGKTKRFKSGSLLEAGKNVLLGVFILLLIKFIKHNNKEGYNGKGN